MALDLNDKTANGNNLTNVNTVAEITTALPFAASTIAAGLTAASSQRFTMVDSATLKPTGNFTIECWFKSSSTEVIHRLCNSYSQNTNVAGISLYVASNNKLTLLSGKNTGLGTGTDYQVIESTISVADGTWHHCAGVYNGSTLEVFIDGTADGNVAWTNAPVYAATNYPRIGAESATGTDGGFVNGNMDDVRLWSVARTGTQINDNKSVRLTGNESGLNGYWPFESLAEEVIISKWNPGPFVGFQRKVEVVGY